MSALEGLRDLVLELDALSRSWDDLAVLAPARSEPLGGEQSSSSWVWLLRRRVEALQAAFDLVDGQWPAKGIEPLKEVTSAPGVEGIVRCRWCEKRVKRAKRRHRHC